MWKYFNPNPMGLRVGDCAIRAVARATEQRWDDAYSAISLEGYVMGDMPSSNAVWGAYLKRKGFEREAIPNTCPDCYSVAEFAAEHPEGTYVVVLSGHVVTVVDGDWYDTWDSGSEIPLYYWTRKD